MRHGWTRKDERAFPVGLGQQPAHFHGMGQARLHLPPEVPEQWPYPDPIYDYFRAPRI
jgi:hypothetical protein